MQNPRNLVVFGLGVSAIALIDFAKLTKKFNIIASDDSEQKITKISADFQNCPNISFFQLNQIDFNNVDLIVCAPSVKADSQIYEIAQSKKIKIICDIELMGQFCENSQFIAITGTNGKSTSCALTHHVLKENGIPVDLGGNIGRAVFDLPLKANNNYVLELSSFQLNLIDKTRFNISAILNITPDHLDYHGNMENYIEAKKRIFLNSQANDYLILNIDDKNCQKIHQELTNSKLKLITISCNNSIITINFNGKILDHNIKNSQFLKGDHNLYNIALAFIVGKIYDLPNKSIYQAIDSFQGLKHRLQLVEKVDNINFINDSKATNAVSCEAALKSFDNIYLILGGIAKEGGIESLKKYFSKIKYVFLIGQATDQFSQTLEGNVKYFKCHNLQKAFEKAINIAKDDGKNDQINILLSPACSSFDQWSSFEERGTFFSQLVKNFNATKLQKTT